MGETTASKEMLTCRHVFFPIQTFPPTYSAALLFSLQLCHSNTFFKIKSVSVFFSLLFSFLLSPPESKTGLNRNKQSVGVTFLTSGHL